MSYNEWIEASYIYDANKALMSLMFISKYNTELSDYIVFDYSQRLLNIFYINLCAILDHAKMKNRGKRKNQRVI